VREDGTQRRSRRTREKGKEHMKIKMKVDMRKRGKLFTEV
jgi:hypothetical protein